MTDKIKILYDASFLLYFSDKKEKRSGIYFVAYNLLKELVKYPDVEITLYGDYRSIWYMKQIISTFQIFKECNVINPSQIDNFWRTSTSYLNFLSRKSDNLKDNFIKKVVRYITFRLFKMIDYTESENKNLAKTIKDYDVYLSPYDSIPTVILKDKKIKRFLFLHDAVPLLLDDFYGEMNSSKLWFKRLLKSLNKNDHYFANSESTKNDFVKHAPEIAADNVTVTYLGANENFYQEKDSDKINQTKAKYNIPQDKKYIFSLCTLEPRKNLVFAIKNFIEFIKKNEIEDFVFVLGGGYWEKFLPQLEKEISNLEEYKDKILKIGYVDDEDLAKLYSGAEMFVYPSIYEGFGMPVLEAMQCGCPVITSNVSSLPEVIGDCGIQINPREDNELVEAYEKMYFDKNFALTCSQKGLLRAEQLSWKNCVDKIMAVIRENI